MSYDILNPLCLGGNVYLAKQTKKVRIYLKLLAVLKGCNVPLFHSFHFQNSMKLLRNYKIKLSKASKFLWKLHRTMIKKPTLRWNKRFMALKSLILKRRNSVFEYFQGTLIIRRAYFRENNFINFPFHIFIPFLSLYFEFE